jgi:putative FmdB family regulatory protein
VGARLYDPCVPIYEFVCDECGERFEALVPAGTATIACTICGSGETRRVLSAPAETPRLIKTPGQARKQERKNAQLQARSKKSFGEAVRRARPGASPRKGDG